MRGNILSPEACADGCNPAWIAIDLWPDDRAVAFDAKHNASLPLTFHFSKTLGRLRHGVSCRSVSIATD
ncbi:protein of unknown function [Hyphomicrobium sp. 1Nfss2.1]